MNAKGREAHRYVAYQRPQGGSKKDALSFVEGFVQQGRRIACCIP